MHCGRVKARSFTISTGVMAMLQGVGRGYIGPTGGLGWGLLGIPNSYGVFCPSPSPIMGIGIGMIPKW
eukprot:1176352-Prorocentrum_minimum.AAC.3